MADDSSNGVVIKISGDAGEFQKAAEQVKSALGQIGESAKGSIGVADIAMGEFIGHLAEKGVEVAIEAIGEAFSELVGFIKDCIGAAEQFEDSFNKLNFSLATSGKFSDEASAKFLGFANSMQETTTVSRNLIASSASTLESITSLSEDGLERATKAGLDFAAATGKSLPEALNLIARGAEGSLQAFKRAGIQLDDTGDKAKNLEEILSTLEERFGGASSAAAQTFSGQITGVKNAFEDFEATIGSFITKNPAVLAAIQGVSDFFKSLSSQIENNRDSVNSFISNGIQKLIDGIIPAAKLLNQFLDVMTALEIGFYRTAQAVDVLVVGTGKIAGAIDGAEAAVRRFIGANDEAAKKRQAQDEAQADSFAESFANNQKEIESAKNSAAQREKIIDDYSKSFQAAVQKRVDAANSEQGKETEALEQGISARRQLADAANAETLQAERARANATVAETASVFGKLQAMRLKDETDKLLQEGKFVELNKKLSEQDVKNQQNSILTVQKYEDLSQKEKLANLQASFNSIATLQQSSDSTLFSIGKAAAIANATIAGIQAVQLALASAPPPYNFVIAGLVGVAQAENVAKIAGTSPPTGAAEGALVTGGAGPTSDDQPFMLSKGELVAPAKNFDEVVTGVAAQRGLTASGGDDMAQTNQLLQQILEKLPALFIQVQATDGKGLLNDQLWVNELTKEIREAVQYRGAKLGA